MHLKIHMNTQFINGLVILSPTSGFQAHKFNRQKQIGEYK